MSRQVCSPRIVGRLFVALAVMLLGSTLVLAHNPNATDSQDAAAAAAQLRRDPGKHVQLDGQIEIIHQDFKDGHGRFVYSLRQADGSRVPMHFLKGSPGHLLTGDRVRADGQLSGGSLILYTGGNVKGTGGGGTTGGGTGSSIPVTNTFGSQATLMIAVNFQDNTLVSCDTAAAWNGFIGAANSFLAENSYGQTSITGTAVGCYTIPESITTCDMNAIAADAQKAATANGVNLANYTRYVYLFPLNSACGFAGASYVGGNPSQSWLNGTLDPHVVNHELGHALGLWHSHSLFCSATSTICSNGTVQEYGDQMDVMGTVQSAYPDYNAFQKERLGWLNYGASPSIQTVTSSGAYTIYPYEQGGAGPNALKVLQSTDTTTGAKTWYYLEARQAIGFDAFLTTWPYSSTQNTTTGVLFHLGTDGDGNSSLLLNMMPGLPTYDFEMSLPTGQTFTDSTAGVTFMPTAVSSAGATVQVTLNGASCTPANPSVSVSPSQSQAVTAGSPVAFAVTVTDTDSSGCSVATFNLANALPAGWTGVWSAASLSLSPGKIGSATSTVTSPAGTASGSYNVSVSAAKASQSSSNGFAVGTYVISTPAAPSVTLWTDQSSYLQGQTVAIRVSLVFGTSPDVGASVSVTVISPSGKKTTLSGTTDGNGAASLSYRLGRNAPAGTYQVQYVTAVTGAAPTAVANTSFTVQ